VGRVCRVGGAQQRNLRRLLVHGLPPRTVLARRGAGARAAENVLRRNSAFGRAKPTPRSFSKGRTASAGASSAHPTRCPGSRTGRRTKRARRPRRTGESRAAIPVRGTGVKAWPRGARRCGRSHRGPGRGDCRGIPGAGRSVPAGFLYHGALSTYEKLGFTRDRKLGKHRWVVTRVVEPRS